MNAVSGGLTVGERRRHLPGHHLKRFGIGPRLRERQVDQLNIVSRSRVRARPVSPSYVSPMSARTKAALPASFFPRSTLVSEPRPPLAHDLAGGFGGDEAWSSASDVPPG